MNRKSTPTLSSLIKHAETIPISDSDILLINPNTKIIIYNELEEIYKRGGNIMEIFDEDNTAVLFYDLGSDIGHWVSIIYHPHTDIIYFHNSYAFPPDFEIKLKTHNDTYLSKLLASSGKRIDISNKRLQLLKADIATCGRHSALRTLFKNLTNQEYNNLITNIPKNTHSDELVALLSLIPLKYNFDRDGVTMKKD